MKSVMVSAAVLSCVFFESSAMQFLNRIGNEGQRVGKKTVKEWQRVEKKVEKEGQRVGNKVEKEGQRVGNKVEKEGQRVGNKVEKELKRIERSIRDLRDRVLSDKTEGVGKDIQKIREDINKLNSEAQDQQNVYTEDGPDKKEAVESSSESREENIITCAQQ